MGAARSKVDDSGLAGCEATVLDDFEESWNPAALRKSDHDRIIEKQLEEIQQQQSIYAHLLESASYQSQQSRVSSLSCAHAISCNNPHHKSDLNWFPSQNVIKDIRKSKYKVLQKIGQGMSCITCKVLNTEEDRPYAMKVIRKSEEMRSIFSKECLFLVQLHHSGIIRFIDCYIDRVNYYIVTELGDTDMFSYIKSKRKVEEDTAKTLIRKILQTLAFIHKYNIVHRDIKSENIMLIKNIPKLIDFGDSIVVDDHETYDDLVGTTCYLAPERFRIHKGWELKASEVWSVGVITYEMLTGLRCFYAKTPKERERKIRKGIWDFPRRCKLSDEANDFIKELLTVDPKNRPDATSCLSHPWLKNQAKKAPTHSRSVSMQSFLSSSCESILAPHGISRESTVHSYASKRTYNPKP